MTETTPVSNPEPVSAEPAPNVEPSVAEPVAAQPEAPVEPEVAAEPTDVRKELEVDFKLPEAFADKPWAKDIKSQEDLINMVDKFQAPESADKYEFKPIEGFTDVDYQVARDLAHKAGLPQENAQKLLEAYNETIQESNKQLYDVDAMTNSLKEAFGADKYESRVKEIAKNIKSSVDQPTLDSIMNLPNQNLLAVLKTVDSVLKSYGVSETDTATLPNAGNPVLSSEDREQKRLEYYNKLRELEKRSHSFSERKELLDKLNSI